MSVIKYGLVMALSLAVAGGGLLLSAQQGLGGGGLGLFGMGPRLGENVDLALEFQDQLGLSAAQVGSLEALRSGIREGVDPLELEMESLRASILSGGVASRDGLVRLQDLTVQYQAASEPFRAEVVSILTVAQHQILQGIMLETRPLPASGQGLGLAGSTRLGFGRSSGIGFGRSAGVGLRGVGAMRLGRGSVRGMGRGAGRGFGRGMGLRRWY